MQVTFRETRLFGWLALVLALAFAGIATGSYLHARSALRQALLERTLPLAGDLVVARMRATPSFDSVDINDPVVSDWLAPGEGEAPNPQRRTYFVDATGRMLAGGYAIRDTAGLHVIADNILNRDTKPTRLSYEQGGQTILLSSRYIPELGWYLLVERNLDEETRRAFRLLILNLAIGAGAIVLALGLVAWAATLYHQRTARMGAADPLTGLANQHSFEILLDQSVRDMQRTHQALSLIRFEIDSLEGVMDTDGNLLGEHVLYTVAQLANGVVRSNDIVARWGGYGYIILLRECPLEVATRTAETLVAAIAHHRFDVSVTISISAGVAVCALEELPVSLLERAQHALVAARTKGPGSIVIAPPARVPSGAPSPLVET